MRALETRIPREWLARLWLYVGFRCNLFCDYCVSDAGPRVARPGLDLPTFRALVDEAVDLGFEQVAVSGGEPFLHPDILPMLDYASARLPTLVLTNATLLTSPSLAGLGRLSGGSLVVQVSLDSAESGQHDRHRGSGSWQRTVAGLRRLLDWGFPVAVRATLTDQDARDLQRWRHFLAGLGIPEDRCYAMPVAIGGRSTAGIDSSPDSLSIEPAVAGDGLFWHPLRVAPDQAIARECLPLAEALGRLARELGQGEPREPQKGYR